MVPVTETFPGVQPTVNQKSDSQAVPVGEEDLWWDAGDSNEVGQFDVVLSRMSRLHAMVTAIAADGHNGKVFRFTCRDGGSGLGSTSTSLASCLNIAFSAAMETL